MTQNIKKFIEDNIEVLETNPVDFFQRTYEQGQLDRADVAYMSAILSEAGIENIELAQEMALLGIIDDQIAGWSLSDGGVSSMPLYDFIEAFLDNCIGFGENYVLLYMKEHAERWRKWAKIYMLHDMTVIERI